MLPDWIVVGAGTAGSVLAARLTEDGRRRALLIEAGHKPTSQFVAIPAGFAKLFKSDHDWNFESEPQLGGRRIIYTPRGRMLGGSSNMNAQMHTWCHPADYDEWAAQGATGWSWDDVAPILRSQENFQGPDTAFPRGHSGPMLTETNRHVHPLAHSFVQAAHAAGITGPADCNGGAAEGAWITQIAHRRGKRFSAYNAYLEPAIATGRVDTITGAVAASLLIESGRCTGVRILRDGRIEDLRAGRGVVLAAGAFGSPQILMLSGIGPGDHLQSHGIPVLRDLPAVGANLQDHPAAAVVVSCHRKDTLKNAESIGNLLRYLLFKRGPLASNAVEALAFTRIGGDEPAPNLELAIAPFEWRNEGLEPPQVHAFSIAVIGIKPRSRGTLRLASPDPAAKPRIDFALLTDPEGIDRRVMIEGLRLTRRIVATQPLAAESADELLPGPGALSDDDLYEYLAGNIQTLYHPTGTCRMGTDSGSVVTPDLRLRGVEGLWIADASVMPSVPRGHPNAVVAMIANKAAGILNSP